MDNIEKEVCIVCKGTKFVSDGHIRYACPICSLAESLTVKDEPNKESIPVITGVVMTKKPGRPKRNG